MIKSHDAVSYDPGVMALTVGWRSLKLETLSRWPVGTVGFAGALEAVFRAIRSCRSSPTSQPDPEKAMTAIA